MRHHLFSAIKTQATIPSHRPGQPAASQGSHYYPRYRQAMAPLSYQIPSLDGLFQAKPLIACSPAEWWGECSHV